MFFFYAGRTSSLPMAIRPLFASRPLEEGTLFFGNVDFARHSDKFGTASACVPLSVVEAKAHRLGICGLLDASRLLESLDLDHLSRIRYHFIYHCYLGSTRPPLRYSILGPTLQPLSRLCSVSRRSAALSTPLGLGRAWGGEGLDVEPGT